MIWFLTQKLANFRFSNFLKISKIYNLIFFSKKFVSYYLFFEPLREQNVCDLKHFSTAQRAKLSFAVDDTKYSHLVYLDVLQFTPVIL